jgi:hypothetical protein
MKKKLFLLIAALCFLLFWAQAQCVNPDKSAELSINNIRALFKTNGTHFFKENAEFEVPKGSGNHTFFAASLWLAGKDEQNNLHVAAQKWALVVNDYWAGPVSAGGANASASYDKVWKITKVQVENHKLNYASPDYVMPDVIAHWPAHGRAEYSESAYLAPYKSVSGNSTYTPSQGDYPVIRGDEALFWINNDICGAHTDSGGDPLGVEILSMAYAYNGTDEILNHTIFLSYVIRNKSENNYKDFYAGFFADFDIGYSSDDYIGCDSLLNMAYGYNGKEIDGYGQAWAYGEHPPAQGAMFLNQKMNSFMYFNNNTGGASWATTDPDIAPHYYNYLQAKWKDETPLTLWGTGYNPGSTEYTHFAFSGDRESGWTEFTPNGPDSNPNKPDDRRGMMSVGPFTLDAGKSICIDIALPFARDMVGDHISSVTLLKQHAQHIQQFYNSQNYENGCDLNVGIIETENLNGKLLIYPNPSNGQFVVTSDLKIKDIELYDILGKKVFSDTPKAQTAQIKTGLSQGLYIYRIMLDDNSIRSGKIVVQ